METIDLSNGFSINSNTNSKPEPQMIIQTKKAEGNLISKEISKPFKGDLDNVKRHQEFVLMLSRYGTSSRFGEYLKSLSFQLNPIKLRKLKLEDLEELLERVRTSVANRTISDVWTNSITAGLSMAENLCTQTRLNDTIKLKGLTEMLKDDEAFLDLLEELKLNNQNLAYVSPYTRLAYTLLTSVMTVHGINTMLDKKALKSQPSQPEQPQTEKKITTKTNVTEKIYNID